MTLPFPTGGYFYIRNPNVAGFGIDANTPHLSAEWNGTFDDVVQLYAVNGASTPHRLENVHISSSGPAFAVVGPPTTIVDNPSIDAVNGYELNFTDGSFVDVWQQAAEVQLAPADLGDIYASYNGSTHVVFSTAGTDTLLGATALADGKIAVLVSSGGNEEIIIQSKDGSGATAQLVLANPWDSNPQRGSIAQVADGNLVVTYAESQVQNGEQFFIVHQEVINELGDVSHAWYSPTDTGGLVLVTPEFTTIPFANGPGYLGIFETTDKGGGLILSVAGFLNGIRNTPVVPVQTWYPFPPDIHPTGARLLDGGFVIAWDFQGEIYARNYHFNSANTALVPDDVAYFVSPLASPFDPTPPVVAYAPSVAALADGRYAIAWEEVGPNGSYFTSRGAIFDTRTTGVTLTAPPTGADFVGTPFNDKFIGGAGNDTFTPNGGTDTIDGGGGWNTVVYNFASTAANIQHNPDGSWSIFNTGFTDTITNVQAAQFTDKTVFLTPVVFSAGLIQAEDFAITRATLPLDQAASIASSINSGAQTEAQLISNLLSQVANTTIPAVAVEGSMYGAVGSAAEITLLATQFLPAQVANAMQNGLIPQVYACEALGLVFAFGNENGGLAFASNFGPHGTMPNTPAGDAAFAAAAASAIFGTAATASTPGAIQAFVANWKAFYTSNGIPGIGHSSDLFVDYAARGAAWGDAVGVALANNLGPLNGQAMNFLDDAVRGTATYAAPLASQPTHAPFLGAATASAAGVASSVQLTGVAANVDHIIM